LKHLKEKNTLLISLKVNKPMKIACLGDSLTAPYEIDPHLCWTSICSNQLKLPFSNYGISGDTTTGMLARLPAILQEDDFTHVIVYGGTNDLYMNVSSQTIIANITAMTRQIAHADMIPIVGLASQLHLGEGMASIFLSNAQLVERMSLFRDQLKSHLVMDQQLHYDFNTGIDSTSLMKDGVHYNELGHQKISQHLSHFLTKLGS